MPPPSTQTVAGVPQCVWECCDIEAHIASREHVEALFGIKGIEQDIIAGNKANGPVSPSE